MDTKQPTRANALRSQILDLVTEYHAEAFPERPFVGGISNIPVSGKVFDDHEIRLLVDSSLDFWLTTAASPRSSRPGSPRSWASGTPCS